MRRVRVGDFVLGDKEKKAIMAVLDSGRISEGEQVHKFERQWSSFIGVKSCVATSSGAGALIAGLEALKHLRGYRPGMKVITTPLTYIATSSAISKVGFDPVYVDIDRDSFGITPEAIEDHLENADNTKDYAMIVPVDLMGFPVQIDRINAIAGKYGLDVLEDAAQAHGSVYEGHRCGSQALIATYSFYIAHNIQAGEMGACVTNDPEISRLIRKIKAQGRACDCPVCTRNTSGCIKINPEDRDDQDWQDPRFTHDLIGYNFKTMEFQAVLAITQLKLVDEIIRKRQENVRYLNDHLKKHRDVLMLPRYSDDVSYLAYPIVIKDSYISRTELMRKLEKQGIENRPLFGCIPTQQPAYRHLQSAYEGRLPNAEYIGSNAFYIGCHQYLEKPDLEYVIDVFDNILS